MKTDCLISVVIPCYNHGHFLPEALASVLSQPYPSIEVVIVDDGSTDNTRQIAAAYPQATYVHQENQGLAAARNTGIRHSTGNYVVFLDADDWLCADALAINARYLQQHPEAAYVAGAHTLFFEDDGKHEHRIPAIPNDPYQRLLSHGNYIGMIAAVMFQRWVFADCLYDARLRRCEDYELYLRISRKYPTLQHQAIIAGYRKHAAALSANVPLMLETALRVLDSQKPLLRNDAEQQAYQAGRKHWKTHYWFVARQKEAYSPNGAAGHSTQQDMDMAPSSTSWSFRRYLGQRGSRLNESIKSRIPRVGFIALHKLGIIKYFYPRVGKVALGDFDRTLPFCHEFGYNRGGPLDRYYIENFLRAESSSIQGRVLEIGDNDYTVRFGGAQVTKSDVLHVDPSNKHATFIGDLSNAPSIPDDCFDCIILTQTLHLIYDFAGALRTCHRILKPGGVLLLTAPGITPIDRGDWKETWYWSFTDKALRLMMREAFQEAHVDVKSFGNVLAATAFLYGMGLPELSREKLDFYDPQYQVINAVKVVKA
jgi:glycosyltransferase involved in cell wall biosynthesis